jgi:tripartite-type tricarboxylate transporter receptor subunit TctC
MLAAPAPLPAPDLRAQETSSSRIVEVITHAGFGGGTDIAARM